jgi:predicted RNA-binding protein with PIN domain
VRVQAQEKQQEMEERKENMRRAPRKKVNWNEKKKEPISQEEAIQRVRERKEAAAVRKVMKELDPSPKEADLDDIYGLDATSHPPLLLVDGYNIALKHPDLKQLSEYGLWDDVRTTLAKRIAQFGEWTRTQVAIVWDAMGYAGDRGEQREHYEKYKNVTIIWSMNYEADTYIRRAARRINKDMPHVKIMVATGGHRAVTGSRGRWRKCDQAGANAGAAQARAAEWQRLPAEAQAAAERGAQAEQGARSSRGDGGSC